MNIKKKFFIILRIKFNYSLKTLILINFLKTKLILFHTSKFEIQIYKVFLNLAYYYIYKIDINTYLLLKFDKIIYL